MMPSTGAQGLSPTDVLAVHSVSKKFCRDFRASLAYGLREMLMGFRQNETRDATLRPSEFWALKDINLTLRRGTALGLVGANGCGKTTLLRIISGIIKPTHGRVMVRGRISPLLALGTGFNPLLTGRENIHVNLSILGLGKDEIEKQFSSVVAFSELDYALDAPVQTYSSGMSARLGFACAVHSNPDIMLVDEVLAVGDMNFREKCTAKIKEMLALGTSFIITHHNPAILTDLCSEAMYLQRGCVIMAGETKSTIARFTSDMKLPSSGQSPSVPTISSTAGTTTSQSGSRSTPASAFQLTFYKAGSQWVRDLLTDPAILAHSGLKPIPGLDFRINPILPHEPASITGPAYNFSAEEWLKQKMPSDRAIVILRDPRDQIISWIHSICFSHIIDPHTIILRKCLLASSDSMKLLFGMHMFNMSAPSYRSWHPGRTTDGAMVIQYEKLLANTTEQIADIYNHLGWNIPVQTREEVVARHTFQSRSGREPGQEDSNSHFRSGVAGAWSQVFTQSLGESFEGFFPGLLMEFGYETSSDWWLRLPLTNPADVIRTPDMSLIDLKAENARLREACLHFEQTLKGIKGTGR